MHQLMIGVRHKDRIELAFGQMRAVRLTVDDLGVTLMAQEGSDPQQLEWLQERLKASNAAWKICYFHHPLYSDG
jgi:phosphodiesterase/alkaline phosphatase D-like protein